MFDSEEFMAELMAQGGPALASAVEREFRTGWELTRHMAEQRERARSQTPHARSGGVEGLGRVEMSISPESYFYWLNKGRVEMGCQNVWAEDEFRRDYLKDNSQAAVKYQSLNPTSGWTPQRDEPVIIPAGKYTVLPHMHERAKVNYATIERQETGVVS